MTVASFCNKTITSCIGGISESVFQELELAAKQGLVNRLQALLTENCPSPKELARRNLLHTAAWYGSYNCVLLLLNYGVDPDSPHTENGCTALHLACYRTFGEGCCDKIVHSLLHAGADVNNMGSLKCSRLSIEHAIQNQKIRNICALPNNSQHRKMKASTFTENITMASSVKNTGCLVQSNGDQVSLKSVLMSIDVGNCQVTDMLLVHGGDCGPKLKVIEFWGEPLQRLINSTKRVFYIRERFYTTFKLLVKASVTFPCEDLHRNFHTKWSNDMYNKNKKKVKESDDCISNNNHVGTSPEQQTETRTRNFYMKRRQKIEEELFRLYSRQAFKKWAIYLSIAMLKNGFQFSSSYARVLEKSTAQTQAIDKYQSDVVPLLDLCLVVVRSTMAVKNGNVYGGLKNFNVAPAIKRLIALDDYDDDVKTGDWCFNE
ncbi:hypothetical protein HELRODRAFT_164658 [Helobdella robusta]|uniref:Uncharacterized protein n=1 Tax=Helobdella robusta TaxID=6412 RepID=T1EVP4_HELRO|nr:hypothetical protein HELRODRAFT_164658 [Helobdella robusta]ESN92585.1 hypothetical protein HELRODRAFT_164658 [Helobdella robusta]